MNIRFVTLSLLLSVAVAVSVIVSAARSEMSLRAKTSHTDQQE